MKVRNNTNGDFSIVFTDGHSIPLSRGEISRELTETEKCDPLFAKDRKQRRVVVYSAASVIEVSSKEKTKEAPKRAPASKTDKKTIVMKKGKKTDDE